LKKRTKKLFLVWAMGRGDDHAHGLEWQKFFAPLFFKKAASS
jgi:hypothetical protein